MRLISFAFWGLLLLSVVSCTESATEQQQEQEELLTDEMLGQLIMQGFRGMTIDSVSPVIRSQIESGELGNIILFDYDLGYRTYQRNIRSPEQVKSLLSELQALAPGYLLTAVDQEGGKVKRLKPRYGFPDLPSAEMMGAYANTDSTTYYAEMNAKNLQALGKVVDHGDVSFLCDLPECVDRCTAHTCICMGQALHYRFDCNGISLACDLRECVDRCTPHRHCVGPNGEKFRKC